MNKKNLYNEEGNSMEDEEEEDEEDEEEIEDNEDVTESLVDFGDMVIGTENNTGINFYKQTEKNNHESNEQIINQQMGVEIDTEEKHKEIYNNEENLKQNYKFQTNENYQANNDRFVEDQIKDKLDLLDLDLESMPKDDLINLLLRSDETIQEKKSDKKKNNFKFNPRNQRPEMGINTVYTNMQQMSENKDPELAQDFNVALTKILAKMVKESNNPNQEVFDILLSDKEKVVEELNKYEFTKKTKIDEKIRYWLEKKNKSLEIIQEKINEDFQKVHTFTPNIINNKNSMIKRNFGQFLEDQQNHKKKINDKLEMLREAKIKERINDYQTTPKIDDFSKKLVEEKMKKDMMNNNTTKVYDRLYNKRNSNKKSLIKSPSKLNSKTLQNASKKLDERTNILYQDAVKRQVKQKELQNLKKEDKNVHKSSQTSNKYILKKFKQLYKEEVENLIQEILESIQKNQAITKLNFVQLNSLLQNLNFISKDKDTLEEESISQKENLNNPLSSKNQERRLMVELYENLKDKDGLVNLDHLFIFCLSILNLLEYFVVKSFKGINNSKEEQDNSQMPNSLSQKTLKSSASGTKIIKKNSSTVTINDDAMQNLVHKLNLDLTSRIIIHKKYGGLDEDSNFIITFDHARLILKDFNLFGYNYNTNTHKNKTNKMATVFNEDFKPKINPKSVKMSNKYRQKVINDIDNLNKNLNEINEVGNDDNFSSSRTNSKINKVTTDYVDLINLKKKKKEKLYEKIREENQLKELENCTFKPKINTYQYRDNIVPVDNHILQRDQRIDQLYKRGTENLIQKKNKTKDDFDIEKNGNECTFKPNINDKDFDNLFDKEKSNINNDKDVQKFNERMKRGRIEREIRDNALRRGEEYLSPQKYEAKRTISESKITSGIKKKQTNSNINNKNYENNEFNKKYQEYIDQHLKRFNNQTTNSINNDTAVKEEKNSIPLLIIDVNIRPGEKKKITVFEGDTADRLAANFASEHNLDSNTRNKLEALIQSQLSKILSKIVEENQSISEKSNGY